VIWRNVQKLGFTTCGLSSKAEIDVNGTNQAGEFIMMDKAKLSFANANTILLWHHVPDTANLDITFPNGDTLAAFSFDSSSVGVNNIFYSYSVDSCTNVMWGLMPEPGSHVRISNSQLRTIGVWFRNQPAYQVSGLVNNTLYSNFTAPLNSHNIQLINTHVRTWSLYMFSGALGNVDNCIVGEIGTMINSSVTVNNTMVDGSGGYLFAEDTSKIIYGFSYLNSDFHTSDYSIGVMAYSGQNMGRCIAKEKSIMIVTQSNLPQEPEFYNDALVFYLKIESASTVYADSIIPIIGSAWIDKASNFYPIDFGWYRLEFKMNENDPWTPLGDTVFNEVHNAALCLWNTSGLQQGSYTVRITMCDNTPDSNKVEAIKQFIIMPLVTNIKSPDFPETCFVFPNPFNKSAVVSCQKPLVNAELNIYSSFGQKIRTIKNIFGKEVKINRENLKSGLYFIQLIQDKRIIAVDKFSILN